MSGAAQHNRAQAAVLIVEDDDALRELLADELGDAGHDVRTAGDVQEALAAHRSRPAALVVSDLRLPGQDGLALLRELKEASIPPAFIMITAFGTVEQAVEALKVGADDFLTKPLKLDHLRLAVERALETRRLREEVAHYRTLLGSEDFHGMIGRSTAMRRLFEQIRRVANAQGPVLITGESGTGKELVARAIHEESDRAGGPFVAINCAGIPAELMESELFGHVAGAFTGARNARDGLFAEASRGTVLLDEIGEMPVEMQAKLLRVLEDGSVRPVGGNREARVDVRVLAATNRDLEAEVTQGNFREDLFYRLETFTLEVPALRERGDDMELLAAHFIARFSPAGGDTPALAPDALELLRAYRFPGNVRELSNALERAVAFSNDDTIEAAALPRRLHRAPAETSEPHSVWTPGELQPLADIELRYIRHVLEQLGGNKRRAAEVLGIGRRTLYRRLGVSDG